jgi:DNA repair exonuclease SbcCD ATPase subunit
MTDFGTFIGENIGPFESIKLDLYGRGLVLIQGENRDTAAADSNGTGKTSIFRTLGWVLFGKTADGDAGDDILRIGTTAGWGSVTFGDYMVRRTRAKRDSELTLLDMRLPEGERDISGATMKDTQALICKLLGLDFKTFCNTVLYAQEGSDQFASPGTADAERKLVLKKILNLEQLEGAQKAVKARAAALADARKPLEHNLVAWRAELNALTAPREDAAGDTAAQVVELKKRIAKQPKLKKLLAQVDEVLQEYAASRARIGVLRDQARDLDVQAAKCEAERGSAQREATRLEGEVERFRKAGKCPTCGTPAGGDHVAKHVHALTADLGEARFAAQRFKDRSLLARDQAKALRAQVAELEGELADEKTWCEKADTIRGELKAASVAGADLAKLAAIAARQAKDQETRAARVRELDQAIAGAAEEAARIDDEERHLGFWARGFGNQGLISFVLDSVVPELTDRLNYWLRILTDGDITARVDTQTKLKGGEARDKMTFELTIEGVTGAPPSTGQKKKLVLAGNIALGELLANRENAAIDLMLLDEVLDGLDAAGRARVADLLLELRKTHSSIFVISHDPAIVQLFEQTITVVKEGGVARLEAA